MGNRAPGRPPRPISVYEPPGGSGGRRARRMRRPAAHLARFGPGVAPVS